MNSKGKSVVVLVVINLPLVFAQATTSYASERAKYFTDCIKSKGYGNRSVYGDDLDEYGYYVEVPDDIQRECQQMATIMTPAYSPVKSGGKWGFVNMEDKLVIDYQFDQTKGFRPGDISGQKDDSYIIRTIAPVKMGGKWGYVSIFDPRHMELMPAVFDDADHFNYHERAFHAVVAMVKYQGKYGYIDLTGKFIIKPLFDAIDGFYYSNYAKVKVSGKYGVIDYKGNYVLKPKYQDIKFHVRFSPLEQPRGLLAVKTNGRWGYVNKKGVFVIKPRFDDASYFSKKDGLAPVKSGGYWGYINTKGKFIITPRYDRANDFTHGTANVRFGNRNLKIDTTGKVLDSYKVDSYITEDKYQYR